MSNVEMDEFRNRVTAKKLDGSPLGDLAFKLQKLVFRDVMTMMRGASPDTDDVGTIIARAEALLAWTDEFLKES